MRNKQAKKNIVKPAVYIESSVISYYKSRFSRDLIAAAHQQITQDWWLNVLPELEPYISKAVLDEISKGDPDASKERLNAVKSFQVLDITPLAISLADEYIAAIKIPGRAEADAYHLAIAVSHGIDYFVS